MWRRKEYSIKANRSAKLPMSLGSSIPSILSAFSNSGSGTPPANTGRRIDHPDAWRMFGIHPRRILAFILADLVAVPMLMVYRKYYGMSTMWILLFTLSVCIFLTSLLVDASFT